MSNRLKKEESGYSLVEVLAAIVLLSLAILPMVSMFDAGLRSAALGGNYDQARTLANSNIEAAKANPSDIGDESENPQECLVEKEADGPLDNCYINAEPVHVDAGDVGSGSASFKSDAGDEDEDLNMTKVTAIVEWDDNEYVAAGVVASEGGGE